MNEEQGVTVRCVVCGVQVPLADLELYWHVMAHRDEGWTIEWRKA